jgi:hypothetical protein
MTKEVAFEAIDGPVNYRIDDAHRTKYHDSPYLRPMTGAGARSASVKGMPNEPKGLVHHTSKVKQNADA